MAEHDKSWQPFVIPFGKYKGETLQMVRIRDAKYVLWLSQQNPQEHSAEAIAMCKKCIEYIEKVDPFSLARQ